MTALVDVNSIFTFKLPSPLSISHVVPSRKSPSEYFLHEKRDNDAIVTASNIDILFIAILIISRFRKAFRVIYQPLIKSRYPLVKLSDRIVSPCSGSGIALEFGSGLRPSLTTGNNRPNHGGRHILNIVVREIRRIEITVVPTLVEIISQIHQKRRIRVRRGFVPHLPSLPVEWEMCCNILVGIDSPA